MTRSTYTGPHLFDPEIKATTRKIRGLRNKFLGESSTIQEEEKVTMDNRGDGDERRVVPQPKPLRDYFMPTQEKINSPLVYQDVGVAHFEIKPKMI